MLAGCDAGYLIDVSLGQIAVTARVVPVAQALNDSKLTDDERAKLAFTQVIRQYGIDRIGLKATEQFTFFDANGTQPAAFVVSASDKDRLRAYTWDLPFVGAIATKGFFDEGQARSEARSLRDRGFDTSSSAARRKLLDAGILPRPCSAIQPAGGRNPNSPS